MEADINGTEKTGFYPYMENSDICFDQKWVLIMGEKQQQFSIDELLRKRGWVTKITEELLYGNNQP